MAHDGFPSPGFVQDPREEELLRLRAEVETWRHLAEDRGRHLDELMVSLAQVRAELEAFPVRLAEEIKAHADRLNAEHDRS
jgi:hypothetical protein